MRLIHIPRFLVGSQSAAWRQRHRLLPLTSPVLSVHWKSLSTILSFRPIHVFSRPKPAGVEGHEGWVPAPPLAWSTGWRWDRGCGRIQEGWPQTLPHPGGGLEGKEDGGGGEGRIQSPSPVLARSPLGAGCRWGGGDPSSFLSLSTGWKPGLPLPQQAGTLAALSPGGWRGTERAGIKHWPWHDLWLKQMAR